MRQGGVGIGTIILIVVIAAIYLGNHKTHQSDNKVQNNLPSVPLGSSISDVESILGTPDNTQHMESAYAGITTVDDYLYYGNWQFSFENGKLMGRSRY